MPSPLWLPRERYRVMRAAGVPYTVAEKAHTSTPRFIAAMASVGLNAHDWPHLIRTGKGYRTRYSERPEAVAQRARRAALKAAGLDPKRCDHWGRNQAATAYALRAIEAGRVDTLPERPGLLNKARCNPAPPPPKREIVMTAGAIAERARYHARKAKRALESAVVTTIAVLLLCVNGWGCSGYGDPPANYVIDSEFPEEQREVIRAAYDAWCDAVGYCPKEALWSDRGRVMLVDDLPENEYTLRVCPEGRECQTSGHHTFDDNVKVARKRARPDDLDALWVVVAHEVGHYCTDHTKGGLMAPAHDEPVVEIDDEAIRAWERGCNWKGTQ